MNYRLQHARIHYGSTAYPVELDLPATVSSPDDIDVRDIERQLRGGVYDKPSYNLKISVVTPEKAAELNNTLRRNTAAANWISFSPSILLSGDGVSIRWRG